MSKVVIVSPCYNEELVIIKFLKELEDTFHKTDLNFTVVIVDDFSTDSTIKELKKFKFTSDKYELKIIKLNYNVGHQGAIEQGLKFAAGIEANSYIVIDSDGEDDPEAILELVEMSEIDIVFVSRGKRKESFGFKFGYFIYKIIFKVISGNTIHFGNYSMITRTVLESIQQQEFIHYSAFLSKLKFKKGYLKRDRRFRIDGKSKMSYKSLIFHGLNSLIEYAEDLLFFFIRILLLLLTVFTLFGGYILYSYFISNKAIIGWTSIITVSIINSILITLGIIVLGLLFVSNKNIRKKEQNMYSIIK